MILIIVIVVLTIGFAAGILIYNNSKVIDLTEVDFQANPTEREIEVNIEAKDEAEAKEIAELFGMEFVDYYRGYGVYTTKKSIAEIYEIAEQNGYPLPEIGQEMQLFE